MSDGDHKCVICGERFFGWGHNPAPVSKYGECCAMCNSFRVIPERIKRLKAGRPMRGEDEDVQV